METNFDVHQLTAAQKERLACEASQAFGTAQDVSQNTSSGYLKQVLPPSHCEAQAVLEEDNPRDVLLNYTTSSHARRYLAAGGFRSDSSALEWMTGALAELRRHGAEVVASTIASHCWHCSIQIPAHHAGGLCQQCNAWARAGALVHEAARLMRGAR